VLAKSGPARPLSWGVGGIAESAKSDAEFGSGTTVGDGAAAFHMSADRGDSTHSTKGDETGGLLLLELVNTFAGDFGEASSGSTVADDRVFHDEVLSVLDDCFVRFCCAVAISRISDAWAVPNVFTHLASR